MRISDWSSDVCSSDLRPAGRTSAGSGFPKNRSPRSVACAAHDSYGQGIVTWPGWPPPPPGEPPALPARWLQAPLPIAPPTDRKGVVSGKGVSVRVDLGGRRIIKKKKHTHQHTQETDQ